MYEIFLKLLDEHHVRPADVARATKIHPSTFSDWKSGKSKPKQDKLEKIAEFFDVSVDYLMGRGDGSSGSVETAAPAELTKDEAELLRLFRKLNASGKKKAVEGLEDLAALEKYTSKRDASYFSSAG